MNSPRLIRFGIAALAAFVALLPASASACATCFGQSDSPMAKGMNAGIFSLLLVIVLVLVAIAIFFAYILRRAGRMSATAAPLSAASAASVSPAAQPAPTH